MKKYIVSEQTLNYLEKMADDKNMKYVINKIRDDEVKTDKKQTINYK